MTVTTPPCAASHALATLASMPPRPTVLALPKATPSITAGVNVRISLRARRAASECAESSRRPYLLQRRPCSHRSACPFLSQSVSHAGSIGASPPVSRAPFFFAPPHQSPRTACVRTVRACAYNDAPAHAASGARRTACHAAGRGRGGRASGGGRALGAARAGRPVEQAVHVGEQHEQVRAQLVRELLGQAVVVGEAAALAAVLRARRGCYARVGVGSVVGEADALAAVLRARGRRVTLG
jgi:hypothetical protein